MSLTVSVLREPWADDTVPLPRYATAQAAGADVCLNLPEEARAKGLTLAPMERALAPTGLRVMLPEGYEMQMRPRSGLALKHGLTLLNSPGTIDADYRGPLGVLLVNLGAEPVTLDHGMRICQAIIAPVVQAAYLPVETLDDTPRGAGGFGSTGVR